MKKIDVEEIGKEIQKANNIINDYESNYLNLFNELKNSSLLWNDAHSTVFYKKLEEELKSNSMLFSNIQDSYNVKLFIYNSYKSIGNKIYYDFTNLNNYTNCYSSIIDRLNNCLDILKSMDYSYYNHDELIRIKNFISTINNIVTNIKSIQIKDVEVINKVKSIEDKVNNMISNINIVNISSFHTDNMY